MLAHVRQWSASRGPPRRTWNLHALPKLAHKAVQKHVNALPERTKARPASSFTQKCCVRMLPSGSASSTPASPLGHEYTLAQTKTVKELGRLRGLLLLALCPNAEEEEGIITGSVRPENPTLREVGRLTLHRLPTGEKWSPCPWPSRAQSCAHAKPRRAQHTTLGSVPAASSVLFWRYVTWRGLACSALASAPRASRPSLGRLYRPPLSAASLGRLSRPPLSAASELWSVAKLCFASGTIPRN